MAVIECPERDRKVKEWKMKTNQLNPNGLIDQSQLKKWILNYNVRMCILMKLKAVQLLMHI